jgi:hypothetical protein
LEHIEANKTLQGALYNLKMLSITQLIISMHEPSSAVYFHNI